MDTLLVKDIDTEQAIVCPGCMGIMAGTVDPADPSVTHYFCGCGYGLGVKRDAQGIVQAWRENDESRN